VKRRLLLILVGALLVGFTLPVVVSQAATSMAEQVVGLPDPPTNMDREEPPHGLRPPDFEIPALPSVQAITVAGLQSVYAGSFGKGVFRSDDRGNTWVPVNEGMTDRFILSLAVAEDGAVYAGTFRGGVFESRNGGKSWQAVNNGLKRLEIKALMISAGVIYAGTGDGLYRRTLRGDEWSVVTKGLDETLVHSVAMSSDRTLYVGTSGRGIFRYDNNPQGPGWTRLSHGLVDHEGLVENFIRVIAVDKDNALYVGTFDGGVFASTDAGKSWRPISRALPNDSIRGIVTNDKGLFVATGRGVFRSQNQGRQWVAINNGLTELSVQVLIASTEGILYAGTSAGVFRSDDDGKNWVGLSKGLAGSQRNE
jgi:photosystem II stability/assembly factor-like uncharacterized protein